MTIDRKILFSFIGLVGVMELVIFASSWKFLSLYYLFPLLMFIPAFVTFKMMKILKMDKENLVTQNSELEKQINSLDEELKKSQEKINELMVDITARKEKEERLAQLAYYDALTELPNRTFLRNHLKKALARANRKEHEVTVLFLDLDGFKSVNDTLGHDIGDALLKEVSSRLNDSVREEDLISRLGGDEFIIVFEETGKDEITGIADRILKSISEPYMITDQDITVTPSIGIANFPDDGNDIHTLVRNADKAMYFAKNKGKANYQFYTADLENYQPKESLIDKFIKFFHK